MVYVLEGVIESEYADHVTTRPAGEAYVLPPGVKHRSRNPFAAPARLLIVDDAGSVSGRPAAPAGG
ncbi:MAG TPA: cupin domain-containing protein [Methylomirabilota bacterium]|nr:cupin domain-containing protein [Methylomirabilota bacterium]